MVKSQQKRTPHSSVRFHLSSDLFCFVFPVNCVESTRSHQWLTGLCNSSFAEINYLIIVLMLILCLTITVQHLFSLWRSKNIWKYMCFYCISCSKQISMYSKYLEVIVRLNKENKSEMLATLLILELFHMTVVQLFTYPSGDSFEFGNELLFLLSKAFWADNCYIQFRDTNLNLIPVVGLNNRLINV